jgi:MFS family permease
MYTVWRLIRSNTFAFRDAPDDRTVAVMTVSATTVDTAHPLRSKRPQLGLPPMAWAVGSCHLVARAGGFVKPVLVLYLTQERHLSASTAGAVLAAVAIGDFGSQLLGGWLGDRLGPRRTMVVGFLAASVALVALGAADTTPVILAAAVGYGVTSELFRPAGSAVVADLDRDQRVRAYSLQYWAANLGYSIAAATAGVLASRGYGMLFVLNAAAMLVAAWVAVAAVPDTEPGAIYPRRALLPTLFSDRLMLIMALIYVGHFTLQGQAFATLPLLMSADGHSPAAYGTILALSGIVIVVLQPVAVAVLSRRDRATVLATSMMLVGIGGGVAALAHSSLGYTAAVLTWTLGQIGIAVHFGAAFADLAPPDLRGRYMGVASSTWSLGAIFGPLIGTALLQHTNRTWLATAALLTGSALFAAQRAVAASLTEREAAQP